MYAVNEPGRPWTLLKKHVMVYVNSCSLALPALFRDMITVGLPAKAMHSVPCVFNPKLSACVTVVR